MSSPSTYDVFLSYNSLDRASVERIATSLEKDAGLSVWLDQWRLGAGSVWQDSLEQGLSNSRSCVVFLGEHGLTQWQLDELRASHLLHKERGGFHIVPVLLPGGDGKQFPLFVRSNFNWADFRSGIDDRNALQTLVAGITGNPAAGLKEKGAAVRPPFKGLRAFEEDDAEYFFGREILIRQTLIEHLRHSRFLAVVGTSGSGKSSTIRAGLFPALRGGVLPERRVVNVITITPGSSPIEVLAARLLDISGGDRNRALELPALTDKLMSDDRTLHYAVRTASTPGTHVVFFDQFEEVFTLCQDDVQRKALFGNIVDATVYSDSPVIVVLCMRADFLSKCAAYRELNALICENMVQMPEMTSEEIRSAVVEPARRAGVKYEQGLVETILSDVGTEPGNLPLLQHALAELWSRRDGDMLSMSSYKAIGGVRGSIARYAEELYAGLSETEQAQSRRIFLRLVTFGDGAEDTRRRSRKSELLALGHGVERVLNMLADRRLIVAGRDESTGVETVEIVHEALINAWPRLVEWLAADRAFHKFRQHLSGDVQEWMLHRRDESMLYRGTRLSEATEYIATNADEMTPDELQFLRASIDHREGEVVRERKTAQRFRRLTYGLAVLLLCSIGVTFWANQQRKHSRSLELAARVRQSIETGDPKNLLEDAIEAVETSPTLEAQNVLRLAMQASSERIVLRGHRGAINSAEFSPDGLRIVTGSSDSTAGVWDTQTGRRLATLSGHRGSVNSASFSGNGAQILTLSYDDSSARVWDAHTFAFVREVRHAGAYLNGAEFSGDGSMLLTYAGDGSIRVINASDGSVRALIQYPDSAHAPTCTISPDGKHVLAVAGGLEPARMWDIGGDASPRQIWDHSSGGFDGFDAAAWSADSRHFMLYQRNWDSHSSSVFFCTTDGTVSTPISAGKCLTVQQATPSYSRTGDRVVTAEEGGTVRIWDASNGKELHALVGHTGIVVDATFSGDDKFVLTSATDGTARVWDAATGAQISILHGNGGRIGQAKGAADGKRIFTIGDDGTAWVWNNDLGWSSSGGGEIVVGRCGAWNAGQLVDNSRFLVAHAKMHPDIQVWDAHLGGEPKSFVPNLTGEWMLFSSSSTPRVMAVSLHGIVAYNVETGVSTRMAVDSPMSVRNVSPAADLAVVLKRFDDSTISFAEVPSGKIVRTLQVLGGSPGDILVDSSGHRACVSQYHHYRGTYTMFSRLWDLDRGVTLEDTLLNICRFSRDGKTLFASLDSVIFCFDAITGTVRWQAFLDGYIRSLRCSAGSEFVAATTWSGTSIAFDAASGKRVGTVPGKANDVDDAAVNADGTCIATGHHDGMVRLWDASTAKLLAELPGHRGAVDKIEFSDDGTRLLAGSTADGSARLYYVDQKELLSAARVRLDAMKQ